MKMDNKDIAITVLAILNVVTIAVLIYLMATRNRNTAGGQFGPFGPGYLPDILRRNNAAYYNDAMHQLTMRHEREKDDITARYRRRVDPNEQPTWWDIMVGPFAEGIDEAAGRQFREVNELNQKFNK